MLMESGRTLTNRLGPPYLEVAHHDESRSTDPACGETRRVENTVLMLLDDMGIAEQHDHHNYRKRERHKETQSERPQVSYRGSRDKSSL